MVGLVVVGLVAGSAGALVTRALDRRPATGVPAITAAPLPPGVGTAVDVPAIVARVEPAVVTITARLTGDRGDGTAAGTGIILTADGLVVTNAHVVAEADALTVTLAGEGQSRALPATLVRADTAADVALVRITKASGLPTATLGESSTLRIGDEVIAIGNALELEGGLTVSKGIVSALNRSLSTNAARMTGLIQTDAAISSGNSGGPLVNTAAQVVGINTALAASTRGTTAENIGFTIPIDQALPVINRLRR